jgi:hypothetical protein
MHATTYSRNDTLEFHLFTADNPISRGVDGIDGLLQVIDAHAGTLAPDTVTVGKVSRKYSHAAVKKALAAKGSIAFSFNLVRSANPEMFYSFMLIDGRGGLGDAIWVVIPFTYFEERSSEARSQQFVDLVAAIAEACHPVYGWAHSRADTSLGKDPNTEDPFAPKEVYEAYWLNVYGPEMVERIGRDRVLSTPAAHVAPLSDGSVLWLTMPTPVGFASPEARSAQARALAHLREDQTYENALARLSERSAVMAPVQPDWDPDIADLLQLTLDDGLYAHRHQRIAELNRYRPPAVSEWRLASEAQLPDVPDVEAAVSEYQGLYAEQLAALLHSKVPEVMQAAPASLPRIDYHFWHFNYAEEFDRADIENDLVPALGGYLGMLLVRHLGGYWLPRQDLDQAQVIIGDRAWLPFLRARHYMASRQSALDYSLTQFYRTVQRHASV